MVTMVKKRLSAKEGPSLHGLPLYPILGKALVSLTQRTLLVDSRQVSELINNGGCYTDDSAIIHQSRVLIFPAKIQSFLNNQSDFLKFIWRHNFVTNKLSPWAF